MAIKLERTFEIIVDKVNQMKLELKKPLQKGRRFSTALTLGAYFALGVIVFSAIAYSLQGTFSIKTLWVSSLGVSPELNAPIFNYGLQMTGIFYILMTVLFQRRYRHLESKGLNILKYIGAISAVIAVTGIFILTTNDMIHSFYLHNIGAYMFFGLTPVFTTIFTIIMHQQGDGIKIQKYFSIFLLIAYLLMTPVLYSVAAINGIPPETVLGSTDPSLAPARILEWICVVGFFMWIYLTGQSLKRAKRVKKFIKQPKITSIDNKKENNSLNGSLNGYEEIRKNNKEYQIRTEAINKNETTSQKKNNDKISDKRDSVSV